MTQLYKTTIIIWSDEDPGETSLTDLAREAAYGGAYCSKQKTELVSPENDTDWDGSEFFGVGEPTDKYEIGIHTTSDLDASELLSTAVEWEGALDQECSVEQVKPATACLEGTRYLVKIIVESEDSAATLLDLAYDAEDLGTVDEDETYVIAL